MSGGGVQVSQMGAAPNQNGFSSPAGGWNIAQYGSLNPTQQFQQNQYQQQAQKQQAYQDPLASMRRYQQFRYQPQQFSSNYGQPNGNYYGQSFQQQPQMQQGAK